MSTETVSSEADWFNSRVITLGNDNAFVVDSRCIVQLKAANLLGLFASWDVALRIAGVKDVHNQIKNSGAHVLCFVTIDTHAFTGVVLS